MHWTISFLVLYTAICQGSHLVRVDGNVKKAHFTDDQKETLIEIISNLYNSKKVELTEINERFSRCVSLNFEDSSKGWGWNSMNSSPPTCVSVGSQCGGEWRNFTDYRLESTKDGNYKEKGVGWSSPPGWNSPTESTSWSSGGWSSSTNTKTCCNQDICTNRVCCTPTPAYSNHSVCTLDSHCCGYSQGKSICDTTSGICKLRLSVNCTASNQCINGNCNVTCCIPNGACQPLESTCTGDNECCNGTCVDGKCNSKEGSPCCGQGDCVPPATCMNNKCCISGTTPCTASSACCTGSCNTETNMCSTCRGVGESCSIVDRINNCCDGMTWFEGICKNDVMIGACLDTDLCVPPNESMCEGGVCCTTSNSPCTAIKPCCTGLGRCNTELNVCSTCRGIGDSCSIADGINNCCDGRTCVGGNCKNDVTTTCTDTDVCVPPNESMCEGGMCCTTSNSPCTDARPCCSGTGTCNADTTTCRICGNIGDDCTVKDTGSCCTGDCLDGKCRMYVMSGDQCSEFRVCFPPTSVQCQGGICLEIDRAPVVKTLLHVSATRGATNSSNIIFLTFM